MTDPRAPGIPDRVAVVGLGYVGLPLALAFGRRLATIGFDLDLRRIKDLRDGQDRNGEHGEDAIRASAVDFTDDPRRLGNASVIIVAVPTPIDDHKRPDLTPLLEATRLVGANMSRGATVVYESTVYPGLTEERCVPMLEETSGLRAGIDFTIAYSPERVNPGDQAHSIENVVKVVAARDHTTLDRVAALYELIVLAGVHRAPDIRSAEAAKVIENVQRDLNIALMNELAILFHRLGINTQEVLRAAGTKWNFLSFQPGLVGGHCIPVDPYYLTFKAEEVGYHPDVILAGRRINDTMGLYVARETIKLLIRAGCAVRGARVLVLGFTFKENIRDVRNTRVIDVVREMESYGVEVVVHDPLVESERIGRLGIVAVDDPAAGGDGFDGLVVAVPHRAFRDRSSRWFLDLVSRGPGGGVIVDVPSILPRDAITAAGALYWSL